MPSPTSAFRQHSFAADDADGAVLGAVVAGAYAALLAIDRVNGHLSASPLLDGGSVIIRDFAGGAVATFTEAAIAFAQPVSVAGALTPDATLSHSLGTSTFRWNNVYTGGLNASGNATVGGDLGVTGTLTAGTFNPATMAVVGNASVGGTFGATGVATFSTDVVAPRFRRADTAGSIDLSGGSAFGPASGARVTLYGVTHGSEPGLLDLASASSGASAYIRFQTNGAQRASITSGGVLLLGAGSAVGNAAAGGLRAVGASQFDAAFGLTGIQPITPSADLHNYDPGDVSILRVSASPAIELTGIAGGWAGRILCINSIGLNVTIKYYNASSSENNKILTPGAADLVLTQGQTALLYYDGNYWRMFAT